MLTLSYFGEIVKSALALTPTSFNTITQLWVYIGVIGMFVIGLVIYTCYSRHLGFPEEDSHGGE